MSFIRRTLTRQRPQDLAMAIRSMMNLLIVDQESRARASIKELCERAQDVQVIGEASSGAAAMRAIETLHPDVTFLSALLPDVNGVDLLHALPPCEQTKTVLLARDAAHAQAAFLAGALDYLIKPITADTFLTSISRARARLRCRDPRDSNAVAGRGPRGPEPSPPLLLLFGVREHRVYPLDPRTVDYIESDRNYVTYAVGSTSYLARESLRRLTEMLHPAGFLRIDRSLLLNLRAVDYVETLDRGVFAFTLTSGICLRSSRGHRSSILRVLPLRKYRSLQVADRSSKGSGSAW
jgi:DNA-binding LytR/AlgR family response regulator